MWTCISPSPTSSVAAMPALIAFSCLRLTTKRSTTASMCRDVRLVELDLAAEISTGLPSTISRRQPFLRTSVKTKSQILAVHLEHRRAQLDLGAVGQREDGLEDLAGRAARRRLAGARAVRLADRREQQVQVAGDVGHRADGRARVVGDASSARSRSPARGRTRSRRRASPPARRTAWRSSRAIPCSAAALRRRWCRRPGSTCPSPRGR